MTNKNIVLAVVMVIVIVGIGAYLFNHRNPSSENTDITSTYNPQTQGKVVFGVTDAAGDMGNVSAVLVTVNKVEVHSAINGWVTVSNEIKNYDLLALKQSGAVSLLASVNLDVGTYDQVRLMISKVLVTNNGVQTEAKLPSGELKIVGNIVVNADKTSSVVFDFLADKSLHMTGNGKIIFAPVIKVSKQSEVNIELKSNNEIDIKDGKEKKSEDFGMDSKGEIKANFELKGVFNLDENNNIKGENDNEGNNDDEVKVETKDNLIFNFSAQNNSGLSGTATLSEEIKDGNKSVKVILNLKNSLLGLLTTTEPAHIHMGSCANLGGVKYPLSSVINGKSETVLNVSLAEIRAGLPLVINIHKSTGEINNYVACTNLSF